MDFDNAILVLSHHSGGASEVLEASDRSENGAGALVLVNPHVPQSGVGRLRRLDGKYDGELGGAGVRGDRVDEVLGVVHPTYGWHCTSTGHKEELICTLTLTENTSNLSALHLQCQFGISSLKGVVLDGYSFVHNSVTTIPSHLVLQSQRHPAQVESDRYRC